MNVYLLDTSAVLTHVYGEPGHVQVQALFEDQEATILLAAPSLLEMETALKGRMADVLRRRAVVDLYGGRLAEVVPVDRAAVMEAIALKNASAKRLPTMDALIAGCAVARGATFVHRDPHFDAVSAPRLQVLRLTDTPEPPASADVPPVVREKGKPYKVSQRRTRS